MVEAPSHMQQRRQDFAARSQKMLWRTIALVLGRVCLCVIAGVIVTLGLAWGSVWFGDMTKSTRVWESGKGPGPYCDDLEEAREFGGVRRGWFATSPYMDVNHSSSPLGWRGSGPAPLRGSLTWSDWPRWGRVTEVRAEMPYWQTEQAPAPLAKVEWSPTLDSGIVGIAPQNPVPELKRTALPPPPSQRLIVPEMVGVEDARGWPWKCLWCRFEFDGASRKWGVGHGAIALGEPSRDPLSVRALPMTLIWPGFLASVGLWSLVSAAVWMCGKMLVASRRVKSGLCPRCRYDLSGQIEPGCPECGWRRKPSLPTT